MVTIHATYEGDLCCTSVHGPSEHTIQTDAPKDNMGLGRYFSPTDLVATALATCILTTLGIVAQRRGIDLKGARATAEKHMNAEPRRIGGWRALFRRPAAAGKEGMLPMGSGSGHWNHSTEESGSGEHV